MRLNVTVILLVLLVPHDSVAQDRYSEEEVATMNRVLWALEGKKRQCAHDFIKGYEYYAYPHCMKYNRNPRICKQYKGKVPHSVIESAFDICKVDWQVQEKRPEEKPSNAGRK